MIVDIHKVIKVEQRVLCAITRFPCRSHLTLVWFVRPSYKYWCIALNHTPDIFQMPPVFHYCAFLFQSPIQDPDYLRLSCHPLFWSVMISLASLVFHDLDSFEDH